MPLNPATLIDGLLKIDDPEPPKTVDETADKWFQAWWGYVSGMVFLNPATLGAARSMAEGVFKGIFVPVVSVPAPLPIPFFLGVEGAMRGAIAAISTPATLLPLFASGIPAPVPLAPLLLAIVPVGLVSPIKAPPRILLATIVDAWTRMNLVQPVAPGPPVPFS